MLGQTGIDHFFKELCHLVGNLAGKHDVATIERIDRCRTIWVLDDKAALSGRSRKIEHRTAHVLNAVRGNNHAEPALH